MNMASPFAAVRTASASVLLIWTDDYIAANDIGAWHVSIKAWRRRFTTSDHRGFYSLHTGHHRNQIHLAEHSR